MCVYIYIYIYIHKVTTGSSTASLQYLASSLGGAIFYIFLFHARVEYASPVCMYVYLSLYISLYISLSIYIYIHIYIYIYIYIYISMRAARGQEAQPGPAPLRGAGPEAVRCRGPFSREGALGGKSIIRRIPCKPRQPPGALNNRANDPLAPLACPETI